MSRETISVAALDTPVAGLVKSTPGNYQGKIDVSAMVSGDEAVLRAFQTTEGGARKYFATVRVNYDNDLTDPDSDNLYVPLPWTIESDQTLGLEITMTANGAAFPRDFPCSVTNLATLD